MSPVVNMQPILDALRNSGNAEATMIADHLEGLTEDPELIETSMNEFAMFARSVVIGIPSEEDSPPRCPRCAGPVTTEGVKGGFLEIGEWHGDRYDAEYSVTGYVCKDPNCGFVFYAE